MNAAIRKPCEMCTVISFSMTNTLSSAGMNYAQAIKSEGVVHQWVCLFKSVRTNNRGEERGDRPSVV